MNLSLKIALLSLSIATTTSVYAQSKFEGPFVQGALGYTNVSPTFDETLTLPNQTRHPQNISAENLSVFTGNIGAGYSFRVAPQWLLAVSFDYMPTASGSAKTNVSFPNVSGLSGLNGSYQMKNPYNFSVIPGYELSMNQVLYGKVAYTGATVVYSDSVIPATEVKMSGYTLGLGYKQALQNQLYVFAEGLYTKFEDKTASTNGAYSGGLLNSSLTAGASGFSVLVGAGYRF